MHFYKLVVLASLLIMMLFMPSAHAEPSMQLIKDDQSRPATERYATLIIGVDEYFNMPEAATKAAHAETSARAIANSIAAHGGSDTVILLLNQQATDDNYVETVRWLRTRGIHQQLLIIWVGLGYEVRNYPVFLQADSVPIPSEEEADHALDPSLMSLRTWGTAKKTIALLLIPPNGGVITARDGTIVRLTGVKATEWGSEDYFAFSPGEDSGCTTAVNEYISMLQGGKSTLGQFLAWLAMKAEYARMNPAAFHCGIRPVVSQSNMLEMDLLLPQGTAPNPWTSEPPSTALVLATNAEGAIRSTELPPISVPDPNPTPIPRKGKPTIGLVAGGGTALLLSGTMGAMYASSRMRLDNVSYEEYDDLARDANISGGIAAVSGIVGAGLMASAIIIEF